MGILDIFFLKISDHSSLIKLRRIGGFPPKLTFSECVAEVRDSPNVFRIE
jgi:hypothetical protein